jgi:hypothetical protein
MKSAKTIVIVAVLVFAGLSLSAPSAERDEAKVVRVTTPQSPSVRPPTRQDIVRRIPAVEMHKEREILLEAFMVEVKLSALHSLGLPAISEGEDFVTAEHIAQLMKTTDAAAITAGAKLSLVHEAKATTESTTRKGIHTDPPNNTKTEYIDVGISFTAIAEIRKENVFAELEFRYTDIVKADGNAHAMPEVVERNWASTVYLKFGKPAIAGAIQDKDKAAFLIVTANIKE